MPEFKQINQIINQDSLKFADIGQASQKHVHQRNFMSAIEIIKVAECYTWVYSTLITACIKYKGAFSLCCIGHMGTNHWNYYVLIRDSRQAVLSLYVYICKPQWR